MPRRARSPPPSYSSPYHSPYCTLYASPPPTLLPTTHPTVRARRGTKQAARAARAHAEEALRDVEADYARCQDDVRALCRPAPPGAAGQTNGLNFDRSK